MRRAALGLLGKMPVATISRLTTLVEARLRDESHLVMIPPHTLPPPPLRALAHPRHTLSPLEPSCLSSVPSPHRLVASSHHRIIASSRRIVSASSQVRSEALDVLARKRQTSAAAVQAHAAAAIAALSDAEADVREAALTLLDGLEPCMLEEHMVRRIPLAYLLACPRMRACMHQGRPRLMHALIISSPCRPMAAAGARAAAAPPRVGRALVGAARRRQARAHRLKGRRPEGPRAPRREDRPAAARRRPGASTPPPTGWFTPPPPHTH